jgi:hypothetical protein
VSSAAKYLGSRAQERLTSIAQLGATEISKKVENTRRDTQSESIIALIAVK